MSLLTASSVDCTIPRGTYAIIRFEVYDEYDNHYNLDDHTTTLYFYECMTTGKPVIVKEGNIFNAELGRVYFEFEPEDTKDLMVRSYDVGLIVKDSGLKEYWAAYDGNIAVIQAPGGEEYE